MDIQYEYMENFNALLRSQVFFCRISALVRTEHASSTVPVCGADTPSATRAFQQAHGIVLAESREYC